ncbi:MAG: hypothetical protein LBR70_03025 [Lactobacillaceae bacterium]|jgi:cell pole-organizing protein PopZ|nr:hypothetical protein [Lactobacillaceae bacterium]
MADTGGENLTTEQILSSIREILLDGDKKTQPVKEKTEEDVLELTSGMVVKKASSVPEQNNKTEARFAAVPKSGFSSEEAARNIIKSFAKNFTQQSSASKNEYLSRYEKDEDSMLRASISKAVEDWVLKNIKSDFELHKAVREEVAKQVNVWFDANFVNLVNSSIKQELERVMVKVD